MNPDKILWQIRFYLIVFFLGILFSLHTVVFVESETSFFAKHFGHNTIMEKFSPFISSWIEQLHAEIKGAYQTYPVMAYCMDWLSYTCVIFVIFIIGAIKDPVRNIWIIQVYLIACILAALLPFIVGPLRGIPIFWRFIDGSFGIIGLMLLFMPYRLARRLQSYQSNVICSSPNKEIQA